jgi:hypothetical protein
LNISGKKPIPPSDVDLPSCSRGRRRWHSNDSADDIHSTAARAYQEFNARYGS